MPIVSESTSFSERTFSCNKGGSYLVDRTLPDGRSRSQVGFRSRALTQEEKVSLEAKHLTWANSLSVIQMQDDLARDLPRASYGYRPSRAWLVNDRRYTETLQSPAGFTTSYTFVPAKPGDAGVVKTSAGCLWIASIGGIDLFPATPSDADLASSAGKMMRESRPARAGFDLARSIGELKDAPLLFTMANYMPRTRKEAFGAFLNFKFGVSPTGSDLGYLAELVLRSTENSQQMLSAEKVREPTSRNQTLSELSGGGEFAVKSSAISAVSGGTVSCGGVVVGYQYPVGFTNTTPAAMPVFRTSFTASQKLRTFATWEYFIPRPQDVHGRLASYRKKAQQILSATKVTESTVYDLTPWSWLVDWSVDVGGLIRYQRDVADNQIVCTQGGYSLYETATVQAHFSEFKTDSRVQSWHIQPARALMRLHRHNRRKGSPYSMSPTWDLSNQQQAILGALGFSRGAGVYVKR